MGSIANILRVDPDGKGHELSSSSPLSKIKSRKKEIRSEAETKTFGTEKESIRPSTGILKKQIYFSDWKSETSLPMDFCLHSSLHGLKYIGERRTHFVERMFWSIAFTIGLVVACIMISDVWEKYKSNSVIITFAPYETKIEELPFPAVTICNMNKILKSKAIEIMNDAKGFSGSEKKAEALENLYYLHHVCSTSNSFSKVFNYSAERGRIDNRILNISTKNEATYDGAKKDLWKFFKQASPSCSEMIVKCIWEKEVRNCTELFAPLETDNGKCCTFNMVPPSILHRFNMSGIKEDPKIAANWEWDGESLVKTGRKYTDSYPDFPRRQKIPGQSFGLSILLNPGLEEYFCTSSDSHGFRMTAHLPIDVPNSISDFGLAIRPNSEVFVNIRPEVTIADKATIGSFPATQRECYFPGERELSYYTFYTAKNCIDECMANLTYQECHCRRHYQPGEDSKPLCGPKEFHCASNMKRKFVGNLKTRCKMCIPTCNEITYHTETTYTPLQDQESLWKSFNGNQGWLLAPWANKSCSIVHIYFGEDSTNAKLRKELYGVIDLIANFGGLMGLCLGFSGLSLIEVFYFLTLRAWCRVRRSYKRSLNTYQQRESHHQEPEYNNYGSMGGKPLKRTETTTELIDYYEEEDGHGQEGENGSGGFLEMKSVPKSWPMPSPSNTPSSSSVSVISKRELENGTDGIQAIPGNPKRSSRQSSPIMEEVAVDLLKHVGNAERRRKVEAIPRRIRKEVPEQSNSPSTSHSHAFTMNL